MEDCCYVEGRYGGLLLGFLKLLSNGFFLFEEFGGG